LSSPFPIFSKPGSLNQFVSVRNCPDNIGLFQVYPNVNLTRSKSKNPSTLRFSYTGRVLQQPSYFVSLIRIFYEGVQIFSKFDAVETVHRSGGSREEKHDSFRVFCANDIKTSRNAKNCFESSENLLSLELKYEIEELPAGVYFLSVKIYDLAGQPFVDQYSVFKVRVTDVGGKVEHDKLILENKRQLENGELFASSVDKTEEIVDLPDFAEVMAHEFVGYLRQRQEIHA
jgi:hypothetical protein